MLGDAKMTTALLDRLPKGTFVGVNDVLILEGRRRSGELSGWAGPALSENQTPEPDRPLWELLKEFA